MQCARTRRTKFEKMSIFPTVPPSRGVVGVRSGSRRRTALRPAPVRSSCELARSRVSEDGRGGSEPSRAGPDTRPRYRDTDSRARPRSSPASPVQRGPVIDDCPTTRGIEMCSRTVASIPLRLARDTRPVRCSTREPRVYAFRSSREVLKAPRPPLLLRIVVYH